MRDSYFGLKLYTLLLPRIKGLNNGSGFGKSDRYFIIENIGAFRDFMDGI